MARRSRSSYSTILVVVIVLLVLAFGAGGYLLSTSGDAFRTTAPLEVQAYLENSNSLRGNTYKAEGEVLNQLGYSPSMGRLISVKVDATSDVVPMLIPASLSHVNIQRGQRFIFKIEVTENGILRALDLTKA
ncbi:MAG: hypothetical protein ACOVMP_09280 [Chthoniobacterales bacterium]